MTWIKTVPPDLADEELRQRYQAIRTLYPQEYAAEVDAVRDPKSGKCDSITQAHSLIPAAMEHALSTFGSLLSEDLPLTRRQQEMIATLVSALNSCFY